jgi:hypothetical protein
MFLLGRHSGDESVFPLSLIAYWSPALKEEHELVDVFENILSKNMYTQEGRGK